MMYTSGEWIVINYNDYNLVRNQSQARVTRAKPYTSVDYGGGGDQLFYMAIGKNTVCV